MLIMPVPKKVHPKPGHFQISYDSGIILDALCSSEDLHSALSLQQEILRRTGFKLPVSKAFQAEPGCIFLSKSSLGQESYSLHLKETSIEISGGDSAGLFYGVQTLRQILRTAGTELPCCEIDDGPGFPYRGFFHDITRGKVPTLDTLKELADRASFYKLNQLQLYIEHTFAFKHMSEVWTGADPITAEEILLFDEYCRSRHIELVPSLSTFGHLYHILATNSFGPLCELEDSMGRPFSWVDRMLHDTLDVSNPGSIRLVQSMLEEFIPLFSSDKFNIGCDETFDLGKGKSKELAEKVGTGRLYVDFLNQVIQIVKRHGKKVMFWGDVIVNHPDLLSEIPKDVVCLNWNYQADVKEEDTKTIAASGLPQYVCPGVAGWSCLMNDMDRACSNIAKLIGYGRKYGAVGVLNTDWGDYGHVNFFASSMPGMIFGAALSWNPEAPLEPAAFDQNLSLLEYGDAAGRLAGLLRELARQQIIRYEQIVWWKEKQYLKVPYIKEEFADALKVESHALEAAYAKALAIEKELTKLSSQLSSDYPLDVREFAVSARGIALFIAVFAVIKKHGFNQEDTSLPVPPVKLAEKLEYWFKDFSQCWRARNKESELYRIKDLILFVCDFLRKAI